MTATGWCVRRSTKHVFEQACVTVSSRHEQHWTEGGAHSLGKTSLLVMSVSGQKIQANVFARCARSNLIHRAARLTEGEELFNTKW